MCPSGRYPRRDPSSSSSTSSSSEAPEFRAAFDVIDADHDGKISCDDLKAFYSSGFAFDQLTEDDICSMIYAADDDRDGFVAYEEFERVVAARRRKPATAAGVMEEVFRVMDRDGDGKVGFEDLKSYLEMAGMPAGDDDVRQMIQMAGGAEGVDFEALVKILAVDSVY